MALQRQAHAADAAGAGAHVIDIQINVSLNDPAKWPLTNTSATSLTIQGNGHTVDGPGYGTWTVNVNQFIVNNWTMTAASVAVALFIGGVEAFGVVGDRLKFEGFVWNTVVALNDSFSRFGFAVAFVFLASWVVSSLDYRARSYHR